MEADEDLAGEVDRYMATEPFDRGAADILRAAREVYLRLQADGTLRALRGERDYDDSAVAVAILRRVTERWAALGADRAYRRLKRLNPYNF